MAIRDLAAILSAVAWPCVVLTILFVMRAELSFVAGALARKIERARRLKVGRSGLDVVEEVVRRSIVLAARRAGGGRVPIADEEPTAWPERATPGGSPGPVDARSRAAAPSPGRERQRGPGGRPGDRHRPGSEAMRPRAGRAPRAIGGF
ncbi:hypothetical protein [Methylobacterium crusticola]|uniref:hypothetical protein n=1 Tax=Methylobacterium crusticola TaxID=1697972 RepID=UPI000FFB9B35|nr:hypothetical protein [Methylobacterium crusticola]